MAIEKNNNVKAASRFDSEFSVASRSRESMSSDDDELRRRNTVDSEDDDEFDDADSGAGSDDFDLLELGETGSEFCQVGDQTCCIPFELYDLPDLHGILSLDVWNDCLTEEERFSLTKYLPDMDQETFMLTMKELFEGGSFHFGSPITKLFQMLKGGLCEPRVALYRQGLHFFQTHQHYHLLRKHQDSMVTSLLQMREAWLNYKGYSIEEKLHVLNIMRSQKSLMGERNKDMGSDSSEGEELGEALWTRSKGRGIVQKAGLDPIDGVSPALDVFSRGRATVDTITYGQQNPKGLLKVVGLKTSLKNDPHIHSRHFGYQSMKTGADVSDLVLSRWGRAATYDVITANSDDKQETMNGTPSQNGWKVTLGNTIDRGRSVKSGKKQGAFRADEYDGGSHSSPFLSGKTNFPGHGRNLNINQLSDIKVLTAKPSNTRGLCDPGKKAKYVEPAYYAQMRPANGRASPMTLRGNLADYTGVAEPYWNNATQGRAYFTDPSLDYEDRDVKSRKLKLGSEPPGPRHKSRRASEHQMEDGIYHPEKKAKLLQESITGTSIRNGGSNMSSLKSGRMFCGGEETESDSSDQLEEEEDTPLIMSKRALHGRLESSRSSTPGSIFSQKREKRKKGVMESNPTPDGTLPASSAVGDFGRLAQRPEIETYSLKRRQKANAHHRDTVENLTATVPEDCYYGGFGNSYTESERKSTYRLGKNGQVLAELAGRFPMSMNKASPVERRQKGDVGHDFSLCQSKCMQDYCTEEDGSLFEGNPMGESSRDLDTPLIGCTSSVKNQKRKKGPTEVDGLNGPDYMQSHLFESIPLKNRAKKRPEADNNSPDAGSLELRVEEVGMADLEGAIKPQKKTFTLITPTIHTGFSFSIIHLLSAVRMAMITPNTDDTLEVLKHLENAAIRPEYQHAKLEHANGSLEQLDVNNPENLEQTKVPSLTVQDIVNRVRSNPGDPCILETQEPLKDLVRGVLKIFSSKTAPLGAKGWKPLICYEKSTKCWSWTGPVPPSSVDHETLEEVTSPEAWKMSRKMLVKLVDAYANWLKSGQETLKQIGSLPAPPLELMQLNFDEKERFRDLRAQKSLTTISASSDEVRAYFRREEHLRYSVPDRAFSYTAADGKKSIVAPLRRCGGKPTSKARDHFMLKRDRPPHVTILCLVRDAAARLPGSIGTRADVCTLIRDSQYIVENVPDAQVNQIVSGALDRLHYERDPCVQYDGERKLWVYLHREREEEDFEDDGTSSTKKWKRQKKDASEQDDQVTVACHGGVEPNGLNLSSNLNVEPPCAHNDKISDVICDDKRQRTEDDAKANLVPEQGAFRQTLESRLQCQENSMNEDFDGET